MLATIRFRAKLRRATDRDRHFCCPLPVARPGCRRRTAYRASRSNAAARPPSRWEPSPAAACVLPRPLGPEVWQCQASRRRDRLAAAPPSKVPGGAAQTGLTGPSPEAVSRGNRGRWEERTGGAAAAPATHPLARFSPPRPHPRFKLGNPVTLPRGLDPPPHPLDHTA